MPETSGDASVDAIREVAHRTPGLDFLVLFGSRARGDARDDSDWDLAYQGESSLDAD